MNTDNEEKKQKSSRKRQNAYSERMKEKGFFFLCRWIRVEYKNLAIEAIKKLNDEG